MTNLHGDGKKGRRLWIRTEDNRWAPVPYGAGQDTNIKSVNIYNATLHKWMTPTWGQAERNRTHIEQNQQIPSLEVRAPGRTWTGFPANGGTFAPDNPNWISKETTTTWTPLHTDWIRLFHLRPKTDPNWRIVPIGLALPDRIPNVAVNYNNTFINQEYRYFWPGVGYHQISEETRNGQVTITDDHFDAVTNPLIGAANLAQENSAAYSPSQTANNFQYSRFHNRIAGTIDLQAIRERLARQFPQQGVDYIGQYTHIDDMTIRRVIIRGEFSCNINMYGLAPSQAELDAITFTVFAKANEPLTYTTYEDTETHDSYQIGAPTDITATGRPVISKTGAELDQEYYKDPYQRDPDAPPKYYRNAPYTTFYFEHTIEEPGDNSISFYALTENIPIADGGLDYVTTYVNMIYDRISIHYAVDGKDTPDDMHTWDALG